MVRMVPDKTGRFAERPHYSAQELDRECERIVSALLRGRRGSVDFPVRTDDLEVLIERVGQNPDTAGDLQQWRALRVRIWKPDLHLRQAYGCGVL